jgi:hypothetical protein
MLFLGAKNTDNGEGEESLLSDMSKNPIVGIKGLVIQIGLRDELLEQQEKMLVQEEESNQEFKKLLKLEKERCEKLDIELARRLALVSRAQVVLFRTHMMSCKRLIKMLKCNLILFG